MEGRSLVAGTTPERSEEVQRVHDVMVKAMDQEVWRMAEFMVSRRDDQLLGEAEFTLREKVLRMGAQALEATVNDRKKGGTRGVASPVPIAGKTRASWGGEAGT